MNVHTNITKARALIFEGRIIGLKKSGKAWFLRDGMEDLFTIKYEIQEGQFEEYIEE